MQTLFWGLGVNGSLWFLQKDRCSCSRENRSYDPCPDMSKHLPQTADKEKRIKQADSTLKRVSIGEIALGLCVCFACYA